MTWQDDMLTALIGHLVANGDLVAEKRDRFEWRDYAPAPAEHLAACRPDLARSSYEDSMWTDWGGSFEPDTTGTGMDVIVTCRCGQVTKRRWRYTEGGYAELLRAITATKQEGTS